MDSIAFNGTCEAVEAVKAVEAKQSNEPSEWMMSEDSVSDFFTFVLLRVWMDQHETRHTIEMCQGRHG
jgi:hypothetical protein